MTEGQPVTCCKEGSELLRELDNSQHADPGYRHIRLNVTTPLGSMTGNVRVRFCPWCGAKFAMEDARAAAIRGLRTLENAIFPVVPLDELATAPMPMADAVQLVKDTKRAALRATLGVVEPLPSFADLREGDWVRIYRDGPLVTRQQFEGTVISPYDGDELGLSCGEFREVPERWRIIAFKPLRQVVEELVQKYDPEDKAELLSGFESDHMSINLDDSDGRTSLLAAKAALEVMIARKGSK